MTDYPTHLADGEVLYSDYVNDMTDDISDKLKITDVFRAWQPNTQYNPTEVVYYQSQIYTCNIGHVSGTTFNASYWDNEYTPRDLIVDATSFSTDSSLTRINLEFYDMNGEYHVLTLPAVTTSDAGVMSASDKTKLDGIETGAQVNPSAYLKSVTVTGSGTSSVITFTDQGNNTLTITASEVV